MKQEIARYYKLYFINEGRLSSSFGNDDDTILLNKPYSAKEPCNPLCFSNLNHILDWYTEHFGDVVCDIIPLSEVKGQWNDTISDRIVGECQTIIPTNPRYVYSPAFIDLLFKNEIYDGLHIILDEDCIYKVLELYNTKECCCGVPLSFSVEEALNMLLINNSDNKKIADLLNYRREGFHYQSILKYARKKHIGTLGTSIIIEAWNKYNSSFRSKFYKVLISPFIIMFKK